MNKRSIYIIICGIIPTLSYLRLAPYTFHPSTAIVYDRTGKPVVGEKQAPFTSYDEIPQSLVDLIVRVEDHRFWSHPGIDPIARGRAASYAFLNKGKVQGASTIDQQLIKLDRKQFSRSWKAKLIEIRQALHLQFQYDKKEILLQYINIVPFSHGIKGRNAACQIYRGKSCAFLSAQELVTTLAISQLGANPYHETDQQIIFARTQLLCRAGALDMPDCTTWGTGVRDQLNSNLIDIDPRITAYLSAADENTSFDYELYTRVQQILATTANQRAQYRIHDCCVAILNGSGELLSMNLCTDRTDPEAGKINSCLIPRQTGSAVKPFLYLYAFNQHGLHATDTIVDEPVQFDLGGGAIYDPKNFDLTYHGEVTLAYALGNSLNVPAIKLLDQVGVENFWQFLREQLHTFATQEAVNPKTANEVGLSLALGTYEISPLGFTQLRRIFLHPPEGFSRSRDEVAEIMSNPGNKVVSFGQDTFLNTPGRAVKTGTSRKFIDAWVCGVSRIDQRTACLRLGNYNNEPMLGPSSEVGSYLRHLVIEGIKN